MAGGMLLAKEPRAMSSRFEFPWDSIPTDGAFSPGGASSPRDDADDEELMSAWFKERQATIELSLCLDRARDLLSRILADGMVTPASRKRVKHLFRAIAAANIGGSGEVD
jgi:hypothetical protein